MKITRIKVSNNELLGNFDMSLVNPDGTPIDTVILAGENGSGKTTLMSLISRLLVLEVNQIASQEMQEVWIKLEQEEIVAMQEHLAQLNIRANVEKNIKLVKDRRWVNNWNSIKITVNEKPNQSLDGNNFVDLGLFRAIYSDVAINFEARDIQNTTTQDIDLGDSNYVRSNSNLAYDVSQLLIDIANLDNADLADWVRENPGQAVPDLEKDKRIKRFTKAFESIFPNKKYFRVATKEGSISVLFREFGKEIKLKDFSSGEKQIVFRGSFFLKDKARHDGIVVFIDEPEISLHPEWQLSILDYYKNLFINERGIQTSQIFVATHSPFIIHNANRRNDKVFVLERVEGRFTIYDAAVKFFNWSSEQIVQETFGINLKMIEKKIVFVEGILDEQYFNTTQFTFKRNDLNFEVRWIGRMVNGQAEFTGHSALTNARNFYAAHPGLISGKVMFYYDNDCNKPDETLGKVWVRSAPRRQTNPVFKRGIESLLHLSQEFINECYSSRSNINEKGIITEVREPDKRTLFDLVAAEGSNAQILATLNEELTRMNELLK